MKVIPQYKVIGQYNNGRIVHNIEKKFAKRTRYRLDEWKDAFDFKIKNVCNSLK